MSKKLSHLHLPLKFSTPSFSFMMILKTAILFGAIRLRFGFTLIWPMPSILVTTSYPRPTEFYSPRIFQPSLSFAFWTGRGSVISFTSSQASIRTSPNRNRRRFW